MRTFETYTNRELIDFCHRLNEGSLLEDDPLRQICVCHFGSFSLINLMMLAVPLSQEMALRLSLYEKQ